MKTRHLFFLLWCAGLQAAPLMAPVTAQDKARLEHFLASQPLNGKVHYASPWLDSGGLVEQLLFQRALLLGGLDVPVNAFIVPNSARGRESVRNGTVVGGGIAVWHGYFLEHSDNLYESEAIIPAGRFEKGLYTTAEKMGRLKIKTSQDLQRLSVASTDTWTVDWATLGQLKFAKIMSVPTMEQQFKMIQTGWADVVLHDFANTPDMGVEVGGVRLYPIPGVKVALNGTRHFIVSRKHPDGARVFEALQKGLKIMQKNGEIERAFSEAGFYNKTAQGWKLLQPEP